MSIHYLLDGYNIMHQMPVLNLATLEDQRNQLIRFIEQCAPQGSLKNNVTIVFDGNVNVFGGIQSHAAKIIFSQKESADDKIRKIVSQAKNVKNIVVVTDDRDVQYAVGALGAKVSSVDKFLKSGSPKKGQRVKGSKQAQRNSSGSEKHISKTSEFAITSELSEIWLKRRKKEKH